MLVCDAGVGVAVAKFPLEQPTKELVLVCDNVRD